MNDTPTKLFVYGIFLDEENRNHYGMTNPHYATVPDFATFGGQIVQANLIRHADLSLTGLLVDYDPNRWQSLDLLEGGYDRIIVTTTTGERAFMYATKGLVGFTNYSTYVPRSYS